MRTNAQFRSGLAPQELFNEIIGYNWNDIPSLKACSLAHRNMTVPSQKRLFSICLQAPRKRLKILTSVKNEISGTSYDFLSGLLTSQDMYNLYFVMDYGPCYRAKNVADLDILEDIDPASSESGLLHEGCELVPFKSTFRPAARKTCNPATGIISRWLVHDKYPSPAQ